MSSIVDLTMNRMQEWERVSTLVRGFADGGNDKDGLWTTMKTLGLLVSWMTWIMIREAGILWRLEYPEPLWRRIALQCLYYFLYYFTEHEVCANASENASLEPESPCESLMLAS